MSVANAAGRRDAVRVPGVPVLLLPVPAQHLAADANYGELSLLFSSILLKDLLQTLGSRLKIQNLKTYK